MPGKHNAGGCGCCDCDCRVEGIWGPSEETCDLSFVVTVVQVDCETITDHSTVDLTLVVTDSSDVVIGESTITTGILGWTIFKPTPGETYTATLTLVCGETTTEVTYDYTVAEDFNSDCNCCTEREVDFVSISGFTGCCDFVNGTWALARSGSSCLFGMAETDPLDDPADWCDAAEACDSGTGGSGPNLGTYYIWPISFFAQATLPTTSGNVVIEIYVRCEVYRNVGAGCVRFGSTQHYYKFETDCNSSYATMTDRTYQYTPVPSWGTSPLEGCGSVTPTVSVGISDV